MIFHKSSQKKYILTFREQDLTTSKKVFAVNDLEALSLCREFFMNKGEGYDIITLYDEIENRYLIDHRTAEEARVKKEIDALIGQLHGLAEFLTENGFTSRTSSRRST